MEKLPISVLICTKNEESRLLPCLQTLHAFSEIIVIDSDSDDKTPELAKEAGAVVIPYHWNNKYPKKRQWCLENVPVKNDWVLFLDADEMMTRGLAREIRKHFQGGPPKEVGGFFLKSNYLWPARNGKKQLLKHGLPNKKLALFNRHVMEFPFVNDLDIPGMGEMEGHYQPVLKAFYNDLEIKSLGTPMLHDACTSIAAWTLRHDRYAEWEAGMMAKNAWPKDPSKFRQSMKTILRQLYMVRPAIFFITSYILKGGFLDGKAGLSYAKHKAGYYRKIAKILLNDF